MKKILFTFCFLLITYYLFSQVNILYNDGVNTLANDITKYDDDNYFFSTFDGYYTKLRRIDSNGTIINEITLNSVNTQMQPAAINCLLIKNNKIYFLNNETFYGDTTKYFLSLTCFNINLDTIWNKKYFVDTTKIIINSITNTNDNGFAFGGNISKNDEYNNCILIKTDSLGNILWYNEYGYANIYDKITNITQTPDSGFILSGSTEKYGKSDWYIVRTDSLGNQIWDWVLHNPQNLSDGAVADLIQTQDGNFVAGGRQTYACDNYCFRNSRLLKFDINKNILLDTLYYEKYENNGTELRDSTNSAFAKIKQKLNGEFLVLVYHAGFMGEHPVETTNLYELNNNFSVKSKRNFRVVPAMVGVFEYIKDFIIEQDGSLAMIGDVNSGGQTTPSQQVWFVKTDENYCDGFGSCDTLQKVEFQIPDSISKLDTVIIPYKIISDFNIEYNLEIEFNGENIFQFRQKSFNNIQANTEYNLTLSYNNITDSTLYTGQEITDDTIYFKYWYIPVDTSLRSTYVSNIKDNMIYFYTPDVGIQELHKKELMINVYPNPVRDCVNFDLNETQDYLDNDVLIYDVSGREVKRCVINNSEFTIQIGDLQSGIYFIKVGDYTAKFVKK